jgi:hypothetical protein
LLGLAACAGPDRSPRDEVAASADAARASDDEGAPPSTPGVEGDAAEAAAAATVASRVAERDIAVAFDPASRELIRGSDARDDGDAFLPRRWFDRVVDALPFDTGVGDGRESPYASWELISSRADVCAPLGPTPTEVARWCWPELRLVWQSISRNFRLSGYLTDPAVIPAYPEDRALHATYDVAPELVLSPDEAAEARALRDAIAAQLNATNAVALPPEQVARFESLRDRATERLVQSMVELRSGNFPPSAYERIATRPEFAKRPATRRLLRRFRSLLNAYAPAPSLKQLTAFSLLVGRKPQSPFDSAWRFVSLRPTAGGDLAPEPLTVRSRFDGRPLFAGDALEQVNFDGVDGELRFALDGIAPADRKELLDVLVQGKNAVQQTPLQTPAETAAARARLADRRQVQVANTRCFACHQLRTDEFGGANFHNFSAFGFVDIDNTASDRSPFVDLGVSASPRVRRDVAYDLNWLRDRGLGL